MRVAVVFALLFALQGCSPSLGQEEIDEVKRAIKQEYAKDPTVVAVGAIELVKESDRKLTGFMKITFKDSDREITLPCSSTMGDDRRFIWSCGR